MAMPQDRSAPALAAAPKMTPAGQSARLDPREHATKTGRIPFDAAASPM